MLAFTSNNGVIGLSISFKNTICKLREHFQLIFKCFYIASDNHDIICNNAKCKHLNITLKGHLLCALHYCNLHKNIDTVKMYNY